MLSELVKNVEIVPNNLPYKENSHCCVADCQILATLTAVYNGKKIPCCNNLQHQEAAIKLALEKNHSTT